MKKRAIAKLRLDRETLRALDSASFQDVVAGAITVGCTGATCTPATPHALSKNVGCN